ncbi:hypothetical protein K502DRAFT_324983 [Neoconidiobolus thromboides FSU 785]|nr:hypothetical protein K502DRAFT_324983 [Neoconidiobolus thromboides FSU 785]
MFCTWCFNFNELESFLKNLREELEVFGCIHLDLKKDLNVLTGFKKWDLKQVFKEEDKIKETEIVMCKFINLGQTALLGVKHHTQLYQVHTKSNKIVVGSRYPIETEMSAIDINLDENIYFQSYKDNKVRGDKLNKSQRQYLELDSPVKEILSSKFASDCSALLLEDGKILVYHFRDREYFLFNEHKTDKVFFTFSKFNKYLLASTGLDGRIAIYDAVKMKIVKVYETKEHYTCIAFSPADNCLMLGTENGHLIMYDLKDINVPTWQSDFDHLAEGVPIKFILYLNQKINLDDEVGPEKKKSSNNRRSMTISYSNQKDLLTKGRPMSLISERSRSNFDPSSPSNLTFDSPSISKMYSPSIINSEFNGIFSPIRKTSATYITPRINKEPAIEEIKVPIMSQSDDKEEVEDKGSKQAGVELFRNEVEEMMLELKMELKQDIKELHLSYLKQMSQLKEQLQGLIEENQRIPKLLQEIHRLKVENEALKRG